MIKFDLQLFGGLFGGGGGGTQVVEKPVVQSAAPSSSPVQTTSETDSEKTERKKKLASGLRGRASTITGAGNSALTAASSIAKTLLGETPQRKTLGGA